MVHSSRCFRTKFCIFLGVCAALRAWLGVAWIDLAIGVKSPAVAHTAILNGMDEQPEIQQTERRQAKRRWFRFRLSTVLILTAIAAWGMALQLPGIEFTRRPYPPPHVPSSVHFHVFVFAENGTCYRVFWHIQLRWALLGPVAALTAFLAWKAAWAVVDGGAAENARHERPL